MKSTENSAFSPGDDEIVERLQLLEKEIKAMSTKVGNLIVKIDSLEGVANGSDSESNRKNLPKSKNKVSNGKKKNNAMKKRQRALNMASESSSCGGKKLAWILSCAIFAAVTVTLALGLGGENGRMDHVEQSIRTDERLSGKSEKGVGAFFIEKERMPRGAEDSLDGLAFHSAESGGDLGRTKGRSRLVKLKKAMTTNIGKGVDMEQVSFFHRKMNDLRLKQKTSIRRTEPPFLQALTSTDIRLDLTEEIRYYPSTKGYYCETTPYPSLVGHETPEECCNKWYPWEKEDCLLQTDIYATTSPIVYVSNFPTSSLSPTPASSTPSVSKSPSGNGGIFDINDASPNLPSSTTFPPSSIPTEVSSQVSQQVVFNFTVFFGSDPQFCGSEGLRQQDYRGWINTTFSGKACMRWDDTVFTTVDYPWAGLDENYCRNPDGDDRAWCVNEDGNFDYCDVPFCTECSGYDPQTCGCTSLQQRDYSGIINTTFSGKACMRWDDIFNTTVDYPWAGLKENYCRNFDGLLIEHAWCFNMDGVREYCDVPLCNACKNSNFEKCGCRDGNQADYRGSIHTTAGGKECLNWKDTFFTPERYPWAGLEENYCRNPVGFDGQAWCFYGQGNGEWDYCDVPFCGEECENADSETCGCRNSEQRDYRGTINTTVDGKECMRWEDLIGFHTPEEFPLDGLEENYCRNPGGSLDKAWCYDSDLKTQYCDVPYCDETSTSKVCQESNADECECANVFERDYTGTTNVTRSGLPCANWDDYNDSFIFETLPPDSVNYCRNPNRLNNDGSIIDKRDRAWCYTKDKYGGPFNYGWDYCDIPVCGGNDATCAEADKTTCGCRNVDFADYRGNKSYTVVGESCYYWADFNFTDLFPNAGLESHNFCRNPDSIPQLWCLSRGSTIPCYVPSCDPCSCTPTNCDLDSNTQSCGCPSALQADACCNNDECRCEYLKVACQKSIEIGKADFCDEAFNTCCGGTADCMCSVTSSICFDNPGSVCNVAADYCCSSPDADAYHSCKCDFVNYVDSYYQIDFSGTLHSCTITSEMDADYSTEIPLILGNIFASTGGELWHNNDGWLDEKTNYCNWHGISCDHNGALVGIDLRNNNLTGVFPAWHISKMNTLQSLILANNSLSGRIDYNLFYKTKQLSRIDLSMNQLSGAADILISPAAKYVNFSQNNFTFIHHYKKFHPALSDLEIVDLSHNRIDQNATFLLRNPPPNIVEMFFSDNLIQGSLSEQLPNLESLRVLDMDKNEIEGTLPDFSRAFPELRVLKLSNQGAGNKVRLAGPIPESLANLGFLRELHLSNNALSNTIPPELGNLAQMTVLDLSHNQLSRSIPSELGSISVLELSGNMLTGTIPIQLGSLTDSSITLKGNANLSTPAPLSLCSMENYFDLWSDIHYCPIQRMALADFYEKAKGGEWTENAYWLDDYLDYCEWWGVKCDERKNVINLTLANNGLSGKLSERISYLKELNTLDLSANDMKGSIPSEIGSLSKLNYLRLCYNGFTGELPSQLGTLEQLQLLHLHENRFAGTVPSVNLEFRGFDESSFISDCGVPSVFDDPLICVDCTMCCNSRSECYPTEETNIQKSNFSSYKEFSWVFFLSITCLAITIYLASNTLDKYKHRSEPNRTSLQRRESMKRRAKKYAVDKMGERSVYSFFLGKNWCGWMIALAILGVQLWVLFVFVIGAEQDLSDDKSDFIFTWKCFRDEETCSNDADLDATGWIIFGILMTSHLLPDIINGAKMVVLSGKVCYDFTQRARFFFGGLLLITVTAFTLFTSVVYNKAIATSNTEIVTNAVIILFITDLDEQCFRLFKCIDYGLIKWFGGKSDNQAMQHVTTSVNVSATDVSSAGQTGSVPQQGLGLLVDDFVEVQMKQQIEKKLELFWDEVRNIVKEYHPPKEALDDKVDCASGDDAIDEVAV